MLPTNGNVMLDCNEPEIVPLFLLFCQSPVQWYTLCGLTEMNEQILQMFVTQKRLANCYRLSASNLFQSHFLIICLKCNGTIDYMYK